MADGFFDLNSYLGLWPASPTGHAIGWGLRIGSTYYDCAATDQISVALRAWDRRDMADFTIVDKAGTVRLTLRDEVRDWGGGAPIPVGPLIRSRMTEGRNRVRNYRCTATDWGVLLEKRITGTEAFTGAAAGQIVRSLLASYATEIITTKVQDGSSTDFEARYDYLRDVVKEMARIDNYVWWVDEDKRLWFQPPSSTAAPFDLSSRADPSMTRGNCLVDTGAGLLLHGSGSGRMITEGDVLPFQLASYTQDGIDIANKVTVVMQHDSADEQQTISIEGSAPSMGKFRLVWDGETTQEDVNAQQLLTIDGGTPTSGNFKLSFKGKTTADMSYSRTAAQVQTALEALDNIEVGDVVLSGGNLPGTAITIAFAGQYAAQDVDLIRATNTFNVGAANVIETVAGKSALTWNCEADDVRAALQDLANMEQGDVGVSGGPLPGTPIVVTFRGQYADTDVALMTVTDDTLDDGTLTITETVKGDPGADIVQTASDATSQATYGYVLEAVKRYSDDRLAADDVAGGLVDLAKNALSEITVRVWHDGLRPGMRIRVTHDDYGIDDEYLITELEAEAQGAGRALYALTLTNDVPIGTLEDLL